MNAQRIVTDPSIPADWWMAEDLDRDWIESQQREFEHDEEDEDDRDPQSFK